MKQVRPGNSLAEVHLMQEKKLHKWRDVNKKFVMKKNHAVVDGKDFNKSIKF